MEEDNNFFKFLAELSLQLLEKSIKLLSDKKLLKKINKQNDYGEEQNFQYLEEYILELVSEAKSVSDEIENFEKDFQQADISEKRGEKLYPFLAEVWFGDAYSKRGMKGIKELEKGLKKNKKLLKKHLIIKEFEYTQ